MSILTNLGDIFVVGDIITTDLDFISFGDNSDNTLSSASDLGTPWPTKNITKFVGSTDTHDYFHVYLDGYNHWGEFSYDTNSSSLVLSLTGLSADVDVRVIRDGNYNGIVDPGEVIASSTRGGTDSESINLDGLEEGHYFVDVYQYSGDSFYTLSLSANGGQGLAQEPNDTLNSTYYMGTLNGSRYFSGGVNSIDFSGQGQGGFLPPPPVDTADYYSFSLGTTSNFSLSLSGLSADADVQLIRDGNYNGIVDFGEVIASSTRGGTDSESISVTNLGADTYNVLVFPFGSANTGYDLTLRATQS